MKNIEKNFDKLTGTDGSGYHGSMTENGDKLTKQEQIIPAKEPVKDGKIQVVLVENENAGVKPEGKKVDEEARGNEAARRKQTEMIKIIMQKDRERKAGGEGILALFLKLLMNLLGGAWNEKNLEKLIENSEAMKGLRAYWALKPENKWDAKDYARVLCMLELDTSSVAKSIHTSIKEGANRKGEKFVQEVSNEGKEIMDAHPELKGRSANAGEDVINRAFLMNYDLWDDWRKTKGEGKLSDAEIDRLSVFGRDFASLLPRREYAGKYEQMVGFLAGKLPEGRREGFAEIWGMSASGGGKKKEREELFEEIKEAGDVWVRLNPSGIEGADGLDKVKEGENKVDGGKMNKGEGADKKNTGKKKKPWGYEWQEMKMEEMVDRVTEISKNTAELSEISKNTAESVALLRETVAQLERLNSKMEELVSQKDGEEGEIVKLLRGNPQKLRERRVKLQEKYSNIRTQQIKYESIMDELTGGEKRVLGKERDKELYSGNIDSVLIERMDRIEYLMDHDNKKFKEELEGLSDIPSSLEDQRVLDPNEEGDIDDDERKRREVLVKKVKRKVFLEKMPKIYKEFEQEGALAEKEGLYFQELQRWVGIIMKNAADEGKLRMPAGIYEQFEEIKKIKANRYEYSTEAEFKSEILEGVRKLRDTSEGKNLKFLDYFKDKDGRGISYQNLEGKGFSEVPGGKARIGEESYGYPHSLEATMQLVAEDSDPEFQTGGRYELIDAQGKFHRGNFMLWMDKKINTQIAWDPSIKIDAQRGTTFKAGFSQLTLWDILFLEQYTKHQEYEIDGDVNSWYSDQKQEGRTGVERGWGESKEHPDMPYSVRVDRMLLNAWKIGQDHNDWVDLNQPDVRWDTRKYVEVFGRIAAFNNWTRAGLWTQPLMLPSHRGKEAENYFNNDRQGSFGMAVGRGWTAMRHLVPFTERYTKKDPISGKTMEVDKDNMFYKALGSNGSSIFLKTLAEQAFDRVDESELVRGESGARANIKDAYKKFILNRVDDIRRDSKYSGLTGEKKKMMELLIERFENKLGGLKGRGLDNLKIGLDRYEDLIKLKLDIESRVMDKKIVDEEKKRNYDSSKIVVREEIEREIGGLMRKNINEFLTTVKHIKIPHVPEEKSGGKGKVDKNINVEIGNIEVFTDDNGRMVTEAEWEDMGKKDANKKTVGWMMDKFGQNFERDGKILDEYERAGREYISAVNEEKDENTINEIKLRINALDLQCKGVLERFEGMGMAMVVKVANISRKELNMFNSTRTDGGTSIGDIPMIREALKKSLSSIYGLNSIEEESVYNHVFYPLEYMEIAGLNNTSMVPGGERISSSWIRLMETRLGRMGQMEFAGSKINLTELVSLRLPGLAKWRVRRPGHGRRECTVEEILQGGDATDIAPYYEKPLMDNPMKHYLMAGNDEQADWGDGLMKMEAVRELIMDDKEALFDKLVHVDQWGVSRVNHEKAIEVFGKWWNNIRQVFNSHGIDFEEKISVDGRNMTVMEYFFGEKIRETHKIMTDYYNSHAAKLKMKGKAEEATAYENMAEELKTKPAMAAFLTLVTGSIEEHREFGGTYEQWSARTVEDIGVVMDHFLRKNSGIKMIGNNAKEGESYSVIPEELFNRIMGVYNENSIEKLWFRDFVLCFIAGLLAGLRKAWDESKNEWGRVGKV